MTENYRGHSIQVTRTRFWDAVIIEAETGMVLPTKATAQLREGRSVAVARACELIDLYIEAASIERWHVALGDPTDFSDQHHHAFTPTAHVTGSPDHKPRPLTNR